MSWQRYPNANYPEAYDEANMVKATDRSVNADGGVNEIQSMFNDGTGGTFTVSFDGAGPTAAIAYNASAAALKSALELLSSITTVNVTGTGVSGDPWLVEFADPGYQDLALMTADDTSMTGQTIGTTIAQTLQGYTSVSVTTASGGPL